MGIVRLYLALAVLAAHAQWNLPVHDARQAVQIFFLISGFYMALVLSTRYASRRQFYLSRFLRIYPVYWAVLIGVALWCAAAGLHFHRWLELAPFRYHPFDQNGGAGFWMAAISNLTLFGQDWVLFLQHDVGQSLRFAVHANLGRTPLFVYEVFPQCWSVGLELTFYLLAPWLNRLKSRWLLLLVLATFAARFAAFRAGLRFDPWAYQFFPFELGLFVLGMLGYRFYVRALAERHAPAWSRLGSAAAMTCVLLALVAQAAATRFLGRWLGVHPALYLSYALWPSALAVLFWLFGKSRADRFLGELSFPVYLVHLAVLDNLVQAFRHFSVDAKYLGVVTAVISVALAVPIYRFGVRPWDRKRHALAHVRGDP